MMARKQSRATRPKDRKTEAIYELSTAVAEVARQVIAGFGVRFGWTANFKIAYLLVRGTKAKSDFRPDAIGRFKKSPPDFHGLSGYDALVIVQGWWWDGASGDQRQALVTHELCHGDMSEKGTLRVVKHDLEEFNFVVRQFGAWKGDIAVFGEQLSAFAEYGAPRVSDEPPTPTPIRSKQPPAGTSPIPPA